MDLPPEMQYVRLQLFTNFRFFKPIVQGPNNDWKKAPLAYFGETIDFACCGKCRRDIIVVPVVDLSLAQSHDWLLLSFLIKFEYKS